MDTPAPVQSGTPRPEGAGRACEVFVVDDSPPIRSRLVRLVEGTGHARVVGEASTPAEAIPGILRTQPDVAILDFHLRGGTGLDVLRGIRAGAPATLVVMLSNETDPAYRRICLTAGASCFLDKSTEFERITEMVSSRMAGHAAQRREPCAQ